MKITDIKIYVLKSALAEPFAFSQGWVRQRSATLVEVLTDEGITGWGEAFAQGLEPPEIAATVIDKALKPLVIGADPLDTEVLWHRMYHMTRDYGRKGSVVAGISAVDIALWGHRRQVPPGAGVQAARRCVSHQSPTIRHRLLSHQGAGRSQASRRRGGASLRGGFSLMKVKLGYGVDDDIACMKEIGRVIQGKPITLMVDTNHAYGRAEALRLGRALEEYDLRWYEEPVVPEDIEGYVEMRQKLSMPIAGGENEHTLYGFREFLGAGAVDVAQPDLGSCGGISAGRHIIALAQSHGIQVNPHVWGSAIAQAASLQLIAAVPVAHHSLFALEPVLEYDRSTHPFRQYLITKPIQQVQGWVELPPGPGLGVEVDRAVLEKFRV